MNEEETIAYEGEFLGEFEFADVENDYPFHKIKQVFNAATKSIHEIPADTHFRDGVDLEDFKVKLYCQTEVSPHGTYKFYTGVDEGMNRFVFDDFEPLEEVES